FPPTDVALNFSCTNSESAPVISEVSTFRLVASVGPVPDIIPVGTTVDPGIVNIPGANGTGIIAVATRNAGASGQLTVSADTGAAFLPVTTTICQTNPTTAVCLDNPSPRLTTSIYANTTATFTVFVKGHGPVPFDPASNRIFVRFKDGEGVTRGSTSVAVRTQ